jgi:ABC-type transport system substrate-binding protein
MITKLTTRPGSDCLFQQTEGYTSVLWDGSGRLEPIKDSGDCIIKPIDPAVRIIVVPQKETRVAVYRGNIDIRVTGEEKDRRINEKLEVKISRPATGSRQISIFEAAFTAAEDAVFNNQAKKLGVTLAAPAGLPSYTHLGLFPDSQNTKSPWASNKMRMAAEYALDKAAISTGLTAAVHPAPQNQFLPPGETGSLPASSIREYNVSKAKSLLTEAGYPNGLKTLLYCSNTRQEEAKAIAAYLGKVGIDASLSPVAEIELNYIGSKTPGNLVLTSLNIASDRLSSLAAYFLTSSGFSAQTARPSQLDDMITKAQNQANPQMKTTQILQISQYLADNATYIPLWSYFGE